MIEALNLERGRLEYIGPSTNDCPLPNLQITQPEGRPYNSLKKQFLERLPDGLNRNQFSSGPPQSRNHFVHIPFV
jgi:hypothetical protein